jgi:hypothetical protein
MLEHCRTSLHHRRDQHNASAGWVHAGVYTVLCTSKRLSGSSPDERLPMAAEREASTAVDTNHPKSMVNPRRASAGWPGCQPR